MCFKKLINSKTNILNAFSELKSQCGVSGRFN